MIYDPDSARDSSGERNGPQVIRQALAARTETEVEQLLAALAGAGVVHERPVGDRWGNAALFTAAGGNYDHKLVELVTNMQDAVLLERAVRRHGAAALTTTHLYRDPHAAALDLLPELAGRFRSPCRVELSPAGDDSKRRQTVVFRDDGIGMTPVDVVRSLFRVGSSSKDGLTWQLGAFGRGGLTALPNCKYWVVVTRRQPDLAGGGPEDLITCAVVRWERVGHRQTRTALYGVTAPWEGEGDSAFPLTVRADLVPELTPGTHIAVVGFEGEGIGVSRLGDERSLDTLLDTRLFSSVVPIELTTPALVSRSDRSTILRGLSRRLDANPREDRLEGSESLPLNLRGETFQLAVRYFVFPSGDTGSRRRFVVRDHALLLLSNGQTHAHWTPSDFRNRTNLPKLADRVLVTVSTDNLPLDLRTGLFTADRTELLRNPDAVRLERELASFLDDWPALRAANDELIRDSIRRSNADRSTFAVAQRIGRALRLSTGPAGGPPTSTSRPRRPSVPGAPSQLHDDPTILQGPDEVALKPGRTVGIHLTLDARDCFIPRRSDLVVETDHLDLDVATDITIGELRRGRIRVSVAVPIEIDLEPRQITFTIPAWRDTRGGLRAPLQHTARLVGNDAGQDPASLASTASRGLASPSVALLWTSHDVEPSWTALTAGDVEEVTSDALEALDARYVEGPHTTVSLVRLNEEFAPLKTYATSRAREVGDEGVARAKDRYAVGVGLHLLLGHQDRLRRVGRGEIVDETTLEHSRAAAARAVLAVLPDFDALARETGVGPI